MARQPRLTIAGYPHHVIQRGNNRQTVFVVAEDFEYFLTLLSAAATQYQVAVHGYVLMDNHFHLLMTPQTTQGLAASMQQIGRSYVRWFNKKYRRTGTLFEGRYKSTLIQTERYLLACMAYLDLNPVRAGIVAVVQDYRWSSYSHYAGLRTDKRITPHPHYWNLGNTPYAREAAYVELVRNGISGSDERALTNSALQGWALGDAEFTSGLEKATDRRVLPGKRGRPFKDKTLKTG